MMKTLLTTSALLLIGASALAAPKHVPVKAAPKAVALICPVTGDKIASAKDAAGKSTYKGKTYYFCCGSCKPEFDKDPAKYAAKMASAATTKPGLTHKM